MTAALGKRGDHGGDLFRQGVGLPRGQDGTKRGVHGGHCFGGGGTPRGLGESTVDTCFGEGRDAPRGERMKNRGSHGGHIFQVGTNKKRWTP